MKSWNVYIKIQDATVSSVSKHVHMATTYNYGRNIIRFEILRSF